MHFVKSNGAMVRRLTYVWKVVVMPVLRQSRRPSMEKRTAKEAKYCVPGQRPFLRFIQGANEASLKIRGIICLP